MVSKDTPTGSDWLLPCVSTATEGWRGQARVLPAGDQTDRGEILRHAAVHLTGFTASLSSTSWKTAPKLASVFVQHFMKPLKKFLQPEDIENVFINIEVRRSFQQPHAPHEALLKEKKEALKTRGCKRNHTETPPFFCRHYSPSRRCVSFKPGRLKEEDSQSKRQF